MAKGNKIYTGQLIAGIAGVGALSGTFEILSPGRSLKIKSITVDFNVYDNITGRIVPFENLTQMQLLINVGGIAAGDQGIAKMFNHIGGTPFNSTGKGFTISKPCQLQFDSFYTENRFPLTWQVTNYTGDKIFMLSFLIEVQEQTLFG